MRITLSGHARKRMRERNVSVADVRHVMSGRGRQHPSARKHTQSGRSPAGARLEVVYTEPTTLHFHVVTVKLLDR